MMRRRAAIYGVAAAACAIFLVAAPFALKPYGIFILTTWAVMTIAAIGLNLTLGYAGQVSMAQAAFVGIGAYTTALLTTHGWPFWPTFALAGVAWLAAGTTISVPALIFVGGRESLLVAGLDQGIARAREPRHRSPSTTEWQAATRRSSRDSLHRGTGIPRRRRRRWPRSARADRALGL